MVYESDFYTTRRPYSSRPNVSSYSVTSRFVSIPTLRKVHTYSTTFPIYSTYPVVRHRSIPYVAHKRLVTGTRLSVTPSRTITRVVSLPTLRGTTPLSFTTPVRYPITPIAILTSPTRYVRSYTSRISTSPTRTTFSIRVRPSVLYREYKRIENLPRSHPEISYTDSYLNSEAVRAFDDETKSIRNDTNKLMRKIHTRVERAQSCLPLTSYQAKYEKRYGPDSFVAHLASPLKSTTYNGLESYNPHKYIGKSHLASVRIVGNKAYNTRRATTCYDDDKVRNDVNLLSYYLKNRKAAAENKEPVVVLESSKLDPMRPSRKFSQPKAAEEFMDDELKEKQAKRAQRLLALAEETFDEDRWEKKKSQFAAKLANDEENEKAKREKEQKEEEQRKREADARKQEELERIAAEEKEREAELARQAEEEEEAERQRKAEEKAKAKAEARRQAELEKERLAAEEREQELERQRQEEAEQAELERQARRLAELEREAELERQAEIARQEEEAELERQRHFEEIRQREQEKIAAEEAELARRAEESAAESQQEDSEAQSVTVDEPLTEDEAQTQDESEDRAEIEERRLQEQKQREVEMARLAELEEIAQQEREAELARQAAELAELARQQEAEARKEQEEEDKQSTAASDYEQSEKEEVSEGQQSLKGDDEVYNDDEVRGSFSQHRHWDSHSVDNDEDVVVQEENVQGSFSEQRHWDGHSVNSDDEPEESSKYDSEEGTE